MYVHRRAGEYLVKTCCQLCEFGGEALKKKKSVFGDFYWTTRMSLALLKSFYWISGYTQLKRSPVSPRIFRPSRWWQFFFVICRQLSSGM